MTGALRAVGLVLVVAAVSLFAGPVGAAQRPPRPPSAVETFAAVTP